MPEMRNSVNGNTVMVDEIVKYKSEIPHNDQIDEHVGGYDSTGATLPSVIECPHEDIIEAEKDLTSVLLEGKEVFLNRLSHKVLSSEICKLSLTI